LEEFALVALALYMATTYVRMLFLAGILIPPILARRIQLFSEYDPDADNRYINVGALLACVFIVVAGFPKTARVEADVSKTFPIAAVEYIKAHPAAGNLFHEYLWGGYLIWKDVPVFIDGRGDIYDHSGAFADYMAAINVKDPLAVLEKYKIERALLSPDTALAYVLSHNPDWEVERADNVSILFRRKGFSSKSRAM
jgi:hypothetical protein